MYKDKLAELENEYRKITHEIKFAKRKRKLLRKKMRNEWFKQGLERGYDDGTTMYCLGRKISNMMPNFIREPLGNYLKNYFRKKGYDI